MFINIKNQKVLIVGGGHTAVRKAEKLLPFGCQLKIISAEISDDMKRLIEENNLEYELRRVSADDLTHEYIMVILATDDHTVNTECSRLLKQRHIPVNSVDDPQNCSFIFPALYHNKDVVAGVTTNGKGPVIAQYVAQMLRDQLPEELGAINDVLGEYRQYAKKNIQPSKRKESIRHAFSLLLDHPQWTIEDLIEGEEND